MKLERTMIVALAGLGLALTLHAAPAEAGRGSKRPSVDGRTGVKDAKPGAKPGQARKHEAPPTAERHDAVAPKPPAESKTDRGSKHADGADTKANENRADTNRKAPAPGEGLVDPPKGPNAREGNLAPRKPEVERKPLEKSR